MPNTDDSLLIKAIQDSLLPGQAGITVRAFLAFHKHLPEANQTNLDSLQNRGLIQIRDGTIFVLETL